MPAGPPPGAMPRSPTGGPEGPGASPMLSPGSGAGNQAAALAKIKGLVPMLINSMLAFSVGSKEFQQVQRAVESLSSLVGKAQVTNMVPAGLSSMAMQARKGPMQSAPPPGIAPSNSPPPGMEMPGAGMSMEEAA